MKQYSNATGQRVFALHVLFQVPIWRPFENVKSIVSIMPTCLISFSLLAEVSHGEGRFPSEV